MILGPAQVLTFTGLAASTDLYDGAGILHGWSWRNTSSSARADFELWDGEAEKRIVSVTLCPGESARDWLSGTGIEIVTGLYLVANAGAVNVDVWFRPSDRELGPHDLHVTQAIDDLIDAAFGG